MTTAEMLRAEGRAEGEARGRADLLLEQLTARFGPLAEDVPEIVRAGTASQVQTWATRVLTASTLDEVFDDRQ